MNHLSEGMSLGRKIEQIALRNAITRLARIGELVDEIDTWEGYETRDIGRAFLAETVYDLRDEIRRALTGEP